MINMDFIINTHENVYVPAEDSYLLAENLEIKKGERKTDKKIERRQKDVTKKKNTPK